VTVEVHPVEVDAVERDPVEVDAVERDPVEVDAVERDAVGGDQILDAGSGRRITAVDATNQTDQTDQDRTVQGAHEASEVVSTPLRPRAALVEVCSATGDRTR
jgi:hypothetical protein